MGNLIRISGNCSWKQRDIHSATFEDCTVETHWNDPDYEAEYSLDMEPPFHENSKRFPAERRIYVTTEPSRFACYTNMFSPDEIKNYYKALILSWHEKLQSPITKTFQMAGKWTGPMNDAKEFGISGVFSGKDTGGFDGYALRHAILNSENEIAVPGVVYNFRGRWKDVAHQYPLPNKEPSMKWMFHLSIENCREPDWFTEKLIDCFACRVVPMYFGDPNIFNHFNRDGMILLDERNFVEQINSLKPEHYTLRVNAIEDNFNRSMHFWQYDLNLARAVFEGIRSNSCRQ